jgi:uncharacterized protein (DUF4213/DUF364 family)
MIRESIRALLEPAAGGEIVADVRIGLGYTAVLLDSGAAGLAYTPREDLPAHCSAFAGAGTLAGQPARKLLGYLAGRTPLERAVGLAAANALAARPAPADLVAGDVLRAIPLYSGDRVGMVGDFAPLAPALRARVASLTIFEKPDRWAAGMQPAERALDLLPECTVALLTATILLGDDPEVLLRATALCREVVVLGPSTPILPAAFASTPVTWLSGVRVCHAPALLRVVSEGGGTRDFGPQVERVNVRLPRAQDVGETSRT